jgi:putative endonuclease
VALGRAVTTGKRRRAEGFGRLAETAAVWLLRAKGYRIVARRRRTPVGEIDILARRGKVLAAVEVKARVAASDELLTRRQQRRIARALEAFVQTQPQFQGFTWRFDLIVVRPWHMPQHFVDAWRDD